jgi:hypothetical protein
VFLAVNLCASDVVLIRDLAQNPQLLVQSQVADRHKGARVTVKAMDLLGLTVPAERRLCLLSAYVAGNRLELLATACAVRLVARHFLAVKAPVSTAILVGSRIEQLERKEAFALRTLSLGNGCQH